MEKQIPIYFSSVILNSPAQDITLGEFTGSHLKVGTFSKYGNRNGSYITDEIAEQLIKSATSGDTPVVGFFDASNQKWASHTGPAIASAYGYVESFEGWMPLQDDDGVTRDYAVFNVTLFTKYFSEASKILGSNQSMELDTSSITGHWQMFGDKEYYVYESAKIMGLCVIGSHEPCFSASSFFSKQDGTYKKQFEEFSSLLNELKTQVEEMKNTKGGELPMDPVNNNPAPVQEPTPAPTVDQAAFDLLQSKYDAAQADLAKVQADFEQANANLEQANANLAQVQTNFEAAQARVTELEAFQANAETELQSLREQNASLQASVTNYEAIMAENENNRKNSLVDQYAKILDAEEIEDIRGKVSDFSYDELKSKLAITFAEKQFANKNEEKVPLPDPSKSQFALLMEKYRKN